MAMCVDDDEATSAGLFDRRRFIVSRLRPCLLLSTAAHLHHGQRLIGARRQVIHQVRVCTSGGGAWRRRWKRIAVGACRATVRCWR
jgi:hypothetical protein